MKISKGLILLILVILMTGFASMRFLSDPDTGTHLRDGRWIVEHQTVPDKDPFTYTGAGRNYLDSNWLFQVFVYGWFRMTGYAGLSILVFLSGLLLVFLLLVRVWKAEVPHMVLAWILLAGFLCMEPRITLRPEMFSFLFMTGILLILDQYYQGKKNLLWFLPVILLVWVNMHGLFILGFVLAGSYFISISLRDRKADLRLLAWTGVSLAVCFINPYFHRLVLFPFVLNTRLGAGNIFHQHIQELTSFHRLNHFVFRDYLFILYFTLGFISAGITWKKRKIHEIILLVLFLYLAFASIRNIALFAVVSIPVFCMSAKDLLEQAQSRYRVNLGTRSWKTRSLILFLVSAVITTGLGVRILTGAYYSENNSYARTGAGIDDRQLPVNASGFMIRNGLNGRMINSLGYGGWLSWQVREPVFIDGRLEVIGDSLYREVLGSWSGGLAKMAEKYNASLIVYHYGKYYPWTLQLAGMTEWRLIYLDGIAAIFAAKGYSPGVPSVDISGLPARLKLDTIGEDQERQILNLHPPSSAALWFRGFYKKQESRTSDLATLASFCLQMNDKPVARRLFLEVLCRANGGSRTAWFALADIYRFTGDREKELICYQRILEEDPGNTAVRNAMKDLKTIPASHPANTEPDRNETEAIGFFNEGNRKYKQGDARGAVEEYEKAIRLNPSYYKAYNNLGIIRATELKDFTGALDAFNKALQINPAYGDAFLGRGICRYHLQEREAACRDWQKAVSLGNPQAEIMLKQYCR